MSTLTGKKIQDTYDGLLKTSSNNELPASNKVTIEDGLGNTSSIALGRSGAGADVSGNLDTTDNLYFGSDAANGAIYSLWGGGAEVISVAGNASNGALPVNIEFGDLDADDVPVYFKQEDISVLTIDVNKRVGIGLTNPTEKLHVNGNARITGAIYDSNNSAGTSGQVLTSTATGTDWITLSTGDITSVTAGTNLTGGGTSGDVTLNMATGGVGAGTYGSTLNGTKIDTITVDAYGRVTGVATGATGDIDGVTAGSGLTGGGTSGTPTLNVGAGTGIDVSADAIAVDVSDFMSNGSNNRIVTATGTDAMNAEANLTFDGTTLDVSGVLKADKGYVPEATLTDGATISWNMSTQSVAKITLGGNRTIAAPTNGSTGQFASLLVIQDGTGSRTLTWNAVYEFASDTAPTLSTDGGKADLFVFRYNGTKWLEVGRNLLLTVS